MPSMAESSDGRGMRESHRPQLTHWLLLLALYIVTDLSTAMREDIFRGTEEFPTLKPQHRGNPIRQRSHVGHTPSPKLERYSKNKHYDTFSMPQHDQPDPDLIASNVHEDYRRQRKEWPLSKLTTSLPKFLPDGPRPHIPNPSFLPGETEIRVHEGEEAKLPCTVQHLGARQISWQKVGGESLISIGTDVWIKDNNLSIQHQAWPAQVEDWDLVIRQARMQDTGEYQCQIISTEKMERRVRLTVVVITIEGKTFIELGQTIYLVCNTTEVGGAAKPEDIDWFKDGDIIDHVIYDNILITKRRESDSILSELIIEKATSRDSGTYICRSSKHLIATKEINVLAADSPNVKRGTGTSHTQIVKTFADDSATSLCPPFLWNPIALFLVLTSLIVAHMTAT